MDADLGPADVSYRRLPGEQDGQLVFFRVGGEIDGEVNPTLVADPGDVVEITLVNGYPVEYDLFIENWEVATSSLFEEGEEKTIVVQIVDISLALVILRH